MTGPSSSAELVALGLLDLVAVVVRRHLVRLVDDDEVPVGGRRASPGAPRCGESWSSRAISRGFSANGLPLRDGLDHVAGEDLEVEAELLPQLVLPLLDEAARGDDEAALDVAADHQLLDEQPGHDRLAGAGVVGEQEAQRLAGQHLRVDRRDLVRQRIEVRRLHREVRVEQVGQRIRCASEASRKSAPSASNDHARPACSTASRASSSR